MRINLHTRILTAKPAAFTLVELLVVISIISMLMSIMLPGLSKAREQAQRVVCGSNMRQLGMAWWMYSNDSDDRLCEPDTFWNNPGNFSNWVADGPDIPGNTIGGTQQAIKDGSLWPHTGIVKLYRCKTDRTHKLRSYSLSNTMGGFYRGLGMPFATLTSITRASEKLVFTDGPEQFGWIRGSFWPIDASTLPVTWSPSPFAQITARHAGGCYLSFADLHCDYWKYKDRRTALYATGEMDAQQASPGNQDLERMVELLKGQ